MPPIFGAAAEQEGGLAVDDVEVLRLVEIDDAVLGELVDFAFDHPQRDVAEHPDDVERVLRQRHRHRLDVEEVAGQHRDVVAPPRVHGLPPAPHVGIVDDVVVDEGGGVDELDHRGVQTALSPCSRTGAPPSAAPPGAPASRRSSGCTRQSPG
jgi:hypothetical protein